MLSQNATSIIIFTFAIYFALSVGAVPGLPSKIQDEVIPVLPFWAAVSIGSYLLFRLGWGVFTFNDVPEAYEELMQQIKEAKVDLKKKGVTVD